MAQRKSPNGASKPGARPTGKPVDRSNPSAKMGSTGRAGSTAKNGPGGRPPARKPGKSIVNQKQTPWGLIITTVVLVIFAAGIVIYAVTRSSGSSKAAGAADANWVRPEIAAAKKITGLVYKPEPNHNHVTGTVKYNTSPPTGGNHNPYWANCNGVVYDHQLANENAVHMLEHGAVWITYNPKTITAADLATLKGLVDGVDRMALTPYAGLKTPISLQSWNYQLFVQKASDPRVTAFIDALRNNPKTLPEAGVSCSDPQFVASKSTPGHPFNG